MEIKQMAERLNSVPVRKKVKRLLAVTLAVLMVNPVTGYGVSASAQESETITAFAELSGEIITQQLEVGAEESDIHLPDTLDVTIGVSSADTADDNAEKSQSDESTAEEPQTDETSAGESAVSGNDAENNTATNSEADPILDSGAAPAVDTTAGAVIHADTEDLDSEPLEAAQTVMLKNITWKIDADNSSSDTFDSSENGAYYTYVPVLPGGHILADGVSLPEINVLIGSAMMMRTLSGDSPISIGGTAVDGDDWYALTNDSGTVTTEGAGADNWNVHVTKDDTAVTVTLKDAIIANNFSAHAIDVSEYDLEIMLEGTSNRIGTGTTSSNGYAVYNRTDGKDITIGGTGDLTLTGYYGMSINGRGNVIVDIDGNLTVQSQWQMISCGGQLNVTAESITMDGYYINCGNEGVSLKAEDGDVNINGTGDYGIRVFSDIMISAPSGAVTISGGTYSLYTSDGSTISAYAKNNISLTECVECVRGASNRSLITLTSQTGDITVNSANYQAIAGAKTYLQLSAPKGDITLTAAAEGYNVIAGSGYDLSILAGGTLDAKGKDGITGFSTADIKAEKVNIAVTGAGYGMIGGDVTVTNPEGGNCTDISISGGGGTRYALQIKNLTLKADKVIVAAASDATGAIYSTGDIDIGGIGIIIGGVSVSGTTTIADGVLQVQASGPDVSTSGLDLTTDTSAYSVYYPAGHGYALFTPANGDTPAVLTLHNAEINSSDTPLQLGADTVIKLEGTNYLTNTSGENGVGIRAINTRNSAHCPVTIQGSALDSLYVSAWQCTNVGNLTISGGKFTATGSCYGILTGEGGILIEQGAQVSATGGESGYALSVGTDFEVSEYSLAIRDTSSLSIEGNAMISGDLAMDSGSSFTTDGASYVLGNMAIAVGATLTVPTGNEFDVSSASSVTNAGTINNNGTFILPYSYTAAQVRGLSIPGIVKLYNNETRKYKVYVNGEFYADGGVMNERNALDLTTPPEEATYYKASADNAYIIYTPASGSANAVLTLHDMNNTGYLQGGIVLPDVPVTLHLEEDNEIAWISASNGINITGSGRLISEVVNSNPSAELTIGSGATVNVMYSTKTGEVTTNTVYGSYSPNAVSVSANDKLALTPGAVLTVGERGELVFFQNARLSDLTIGSGASIVNNGIVVLPQGTTGAQIAALPLSGTGIVQVATAYNDGSPSAWDTYFNDGVALKQAGGMGEGLNLTDGDHSGKTVENDGYAWSADSKTLTLGNAYIEGNVTLPAGATVNTTATTVIRDRLEGESGTALNITLSGTAPLSIGGGISGGTNGDIVTVQGGAQVTMGGSVFLGGSGGQGGTLNVTGAGTRLTVSQPHGYAVMCDTVNVRNGASMTANGDSIGVEALTGVNVTDGSTLTTNCDYGVYIIGGKLTVDGTSKLITNATIAPFCIVDSTSNKPQSDVLALAGVPSGTAVASVSGSQAKYWSLVATGGTLSVTDENSTPVTLTGAVQGQKLDFSKPLPATYSVTVQNDGNGTASAAPASAKQGAEIALNATPKDGYKFKEWQVISGGVTITNNKFTMPDGEVTVKAIFESTSGGNDNGGGNNNNGGNDNGSGNNNNGSGSSSGDSSSITITSEKKPDQPVIGSVNASGKVSDNHAAIIITDSMVKTAIEKAQSDAKAQGKTANGIGAEVSLSALGAKSFTIITERAALDRLVSTNVKLFQIVGLPVNICFDQASLKQQQAQGSGDITMTLKPVTVKNIRNAYDIALSTVKDGKTVNITSMGKGTATVSIPYTLGKGEAIGGLYAVSVDAKGKATRIAGSAYDTNSKSMIFAANRFSVYGISYTAPSAKFTDISNHWAKESIDYVVGRGLLSGTSETTFAPNSAMTRGMLVTALGRLANVDTKAYTTGIFTDVKADSAFRPYIEWAYKKGIVQGTGNGKFEPDRAVTREEIAVIFANYAKATGYTLPITREATTYADASSIGSAYKDAVKAMQQAGIMMGGNNNKFNPGSSSTRAEVASMLTRYIKLTIDPATAQGWAKNDSGQWMYFKDGKALTGWQTIDGKVYCFDSSGGAFASGWKQNAKGEWFFLSSDGSAVTGWKDIGASGNAKRYYFDAYGVMIAGKWLEIDGKWYYFYSDGSLARSTKIDGYEVDTDGVRKTK